MNTLNEILKFMGTILIAMWILVAGLHIKDQLTPEPVRRLEYYNCRVYNSSREKLVVYGKMMGDLCCPKNGRCEKMSEASIINNPSMYE